MASTKIEHQAVMMLSPQRISRDHVILESLHIEKSPKGLVYKTNQISNAELRTFLFPYSRSGERCVHTVFT